MRQYNVRQDTFFWLLEGICTLHSKPYSPSLAQQQFTAPYSQETLQRAIGEYGFDFKEKSCPIQKIRHQNFPLFAWINRPANAANSICAGDTASNQNSSDTRINTIDVVLVLQANEQKILFIEAGSQAPKTLDLSEFSQCYRGQIALVTPRMEIADKADQGSERSQSNRTFGFRWFIPELLKHRKLWHEVLLASLVIQLIALATPLFTQTIIDKVIVHRTQSTLIVIAIGMAMFMLFSSVLSWLRQYLILHTGNRVDAILGAAVFERLFKLPPLYFQHRPTGVIAARLHGVETIREFIASTAVTLVLDLPFLLIFVAIMFYYSVTLTLIVLAILALIVVLSMIVAPMFQVRLQEQFQLGARNQAFLTEYIAGMETVKSLQMEPQLSSKYGSYLASYLQAGFASKHLGNTYNTLANFLEQLMSLLILGIGAYTVMQSPDFTIGMLVAFQMFAGKLSQPMLRMVGLWQQFQQASLSVARLGDLMNAPIEPYSVLPMRNSGQRGQIQIEQISFRYSLQHPLLYEKLTLSIQSGQTVAIMGPSGCGKSTLTKLLQGFYQPSSGRILVNGVDIAFLSANELRNNFGVVPQETTLFSGTLYDNLLMANPRATFDDICNACRMAEIHDVIETLPHGYQTEIGERGAGLSGGQKQRIAIARALIKQPSILIFDEATSALDHATAEQFARTINNLRGKITMLFITHGLPKGLKVDAMLRLAAQGAQEIVPDATLATASVNDIISTALQGTV